MDTAKYVGLFVAECRDHLQQCNRLLLVWERHPAAEEPVTGLFRAIHGVKGMAATLGFERLTELSHAFEHLLEGVRDGRIPASVDLVDLGFRVVDRIEQGVGLAAAGQDAALEVDDLAEAIRRLDGGATRAPDTGPAPAPAPAARSGLAVRIRLRDGTAMAGARAALVLQRATHFGVVSGVTPPVELWSDDAFDGRVAFRLEAVDPPGTIRESLLQVGDVEAVDVGDETGAAAGTRRVRVELDRLDHLVALAGEVVIARSRLAARLERLGDAALVEESHRLGRVVTDLHGQVLHARMAPVAEVFERFPRAVRDLARQLGRRVRVEMDGAQIELDRAILDDLPELLLHLIRNAVDHGIEPPDERRRAGKPEEGVLRLTAERDKATVLITVTDDGRGVDREAVRQRAGSELRPGEGEDDEALLRILARPGFSMAARVTDVSGRGVGIDAVAHRTRALGGVMRFSSQPGAGTAVTLRLPLTVAIVPVLVVGLAEERYALPLTYVVETARLARDGSAVTRHRGDALALIELGIGAGPGTSRPGVILDVAGRRGALLVDTLLGREDVVVSPVDAPRGTPAWVNGATILADGRPALVVDPGALL